MPFLKTFFLQFNPPFIFFLKLFDLNQKIVSSRNLQYYKLQLSYRNFIYRYSTYIYLLFVRINLHYYLLSSIELFFIISSFENKRNFIHWRVQNHFSSIRTS